jgi:hypothetical protein
VGYESNVTYDDVYSLYVKIYDLSIINESSLYS